MTSVANNNNHSRCWCFTLNNYSSEQVKALRVMFGDASKVRYAIFSREIALSGTPHLQGYVSYTMLQYFNKVWASLFSAHVEPANHPNEIFTDEEDPVLQEAIHRRFKVIHIPFKMYAKPSGHDPLSVVNGEVVMEVPAMSTPGSIASGMMAVTIN